MITYPEFAYTQIMRLFLFFITCSYTIALFYYLTNLIMTVYGEKISLKRRMIFVIIVGLCMHQLWIDAMYIVGGFVSFTPMTYALITFPNPFFALLYYVCGVKILKLSKYRSIYLMRVLYLFVMSVRALGRTITMGFFKQPGDRYNYMLDAMPIIIVTAICTIVYFILQWGIKNARFQFRLKDSVPIRNLFYELFKSFLQAACLYVAVILVLSHIETNAVAYASLFIIFTLFLLQSTKMHDIRIFRGELENKDINTKILSNAVNEFSGLKHDFYNMLQTYEGYISIGAWDKLENYHKELLRATTFASEQLDLTPQMFQNPLLTSLLIEKMQKIEQIEGELSVNILCNIKNMYISDEDLCCLISELLDTIVYLVNQSNYEHISFSVEQKANANKLIIINLSLDNSMLPQNCKNAPAIQDELPAAAFAKVQRLSDRYRNVFFHTSVDADNFAAYIELSPPK